MAQADQYAWDPVHNIWSPIPIACPIVRLTGAGQVYLGSARLHWLIINPGAPNAVLELTDAAAALAAVHCDYYLANRNTLPVPYVPAMHFSTGIYLETFTNLTSVVFGYTPE